MKVIVLLEQLFQLSEVNTTHISREAKGWIALMRQEAEKLKSKVDSEKQRKLIALFIGGTIFALNQDDRHYHYPFKLYDGKAIDNAWKKLNNNGISNIYTGPLMYEIGYAALEAFPNNFSEINDFSKLFANEYPLTDARGAFVPFFPDLKKNLAKINQLVKFCIEHKDNLEVPELDILDDELSHDEPSHDESPQGEPLHDQPPPEFKDFLPEFERRHRESYSSGFLGGLFNRTNLEEYKTLTPKKVLQHAQKPTFFGFKNRTRKVLEDMKILDKNGELLQSSVNENKFK